ncbi:MAG: hypothetical protein WBO70_05485, partial [Erysipelotrichaceae bacterium]
YSTSYITVIKSLKLVFKKNYIISNYVNDIDNHLIRGDDLVKSCAILSDDVVSVIQVGINSNDLSSHLDLFVDNEKEYFVYQVKKLGYFFKVYLNVLIGIVVIYAYKMMLSPLNLLEELL